MLYKPMIHFNLLLSLNIWLRINNDVSIPEMCIWSVLLNQPDLIVKELNV